MAQPAYDTLEPPVDTELRERVQLCCATAGTPKVTELLAALRKHGYRDDAMEEIALALPEDQYDRVRELNRSLPPMPLPKVRRR